MKKTVLLILSMICAFSAWSQVEYNLQRNYYDIVQDAEVYFKTQERKYGRSLLLAEGSEYNQFLKWKRFWEPRLAPHGDFESYFRAYETVTRPVENSRTGKTKSTKSNTDLWDEIGPTGKPTGGINSIGNAGSEPGVGPIEFIELYLQDPQKMICGSNLGGLFYTTDGGNSWQNSGSDNWQYSGCRTATIDPTDFNNWFAASHLSVGNASAGFAGGIYMTNNMGSTWSKIATTSDLNIGYWQGIRKLQVSPSNTDKLMLATQNGFRYTNDVYAGTIVWNSPSDLAGKDVYDFETKFNNSNHIFATANSGSSWEIKESTDGGATWTNIPGAPSAAGAVYVSMEMTRANYNALYVVIDKNEGNCPTTYWGSCSPISEIWKYNISSGAWTLISDEEIIVHGQSHGFGVSNSNENDLYVAFIDRYRTQIGGSWTTYNHSHPNRYGYHVDVEDFACHPFVNGEVWMANHGGVHRSTDFGATWTNMSNGLGVADVLGMDHSMDSPDYISLGLYHDGTVLTSSPYASGWSPTWDVLYGGDGMGPRIDYNDAAHQWFGSQTSYRYSSNYGASSTGASAPMVSWNIWSELNTENPEIIYSNKLVNSSPQRVEVVSSPTRGTSGSYTEISDFAGVNGLLGDYLLRKLATAPSDPDVLYAHVIDYAPNPNVHRIFKTSIANDPNPTLIKNSWVEITKSVPNKWIGDIAVDFENPNVIYVSHGSTTSGTWVLAQGTDMVFRIDTDLPVGDPGYEMNVTLNLPNVSAGPLELEKGTNSGLYIATDIGVYFINGDRFAAGDNWVRFGDVPNVPGTELKINYEVNKIRLSTSGRGVWEHDLYCPDIYSAIESGTYSNDEYVDVEHHITSTATVPNGRNVRYRAGYEIRLKPGMRANAGSDFHAFIHKCNMPGNSFRLIPDSENDEAEETEALEEKVLASSTLFPNPTSGWATLRIEGYDFDNPNYQLEVYNMFGQRVYQQMMDQPEVRFNISEYPDGTYLVKFTDGKSVSTHTLIKSGRSSQ